MGERDSLHARAITASAGPKELPFTCINLCNVMLAPAHGVLSRIWFAKPTLSVPTHPRLGTARPRRAPRQTELVNKIPPFAVIGTENQLFWVENQLFCSLGRRSQPLHLSEHSWS